MKKVATLTMIAIGISSAYAGKIKLADDLMYPNGITGVSWHYATLDETRLNIVENAKKAEPCSANLNIPDSFGYLVSQNQQIVNDVLNRKGYELVSGSPLYNTGSQPRYEIKLRTSKGGPGLLEGFLGQRFETGSSSGHLSTIVYDYSKLLTGPVDPSVYLEIANFEMVDKTKAVKIGKMEYKRNYKRVLVQNGFGGANWRSKTENVNYSWKGSPESMMRPILESLEMLKDCRDL